MAVPVGDPESSGPRPLPADDPNRRALESIDAVYAADPHQLNEPVARLRRFVRIRRVLYYTILAPFGALSRRWPLLVLASGAASIVGTSVAILAGAPPGPTVLAAYWGLGALSYHALSVRLASLMHDAATSVGLSQGDLLAMWKR